MNRYMFKIEITAEKLESIMNRLTKAQEEMRDCYNELEYLNVLVIKEPPAATSGSQEKSPDGEREVTYNINADNSDILTSFEMLDEKGKYRVKDKIFCEMGRQISEHTWGNAKVFPADTQRKPKSHGGITITFEDGNKKYFEKEEDCLNYLTKATQAMKKH